MYLHPWLGIQFFRRVWMCMMYNIYIWCMMHAPNIIKNIYLQLFGLNALLFFFFTIKIRIRYRYTIWNCYIFRTKNFFNRCLINYWAFCFWLPFDKAKYISYNFHITYNIKTIIFNEFIFMNFSSTLGKIINVIISLEHICILHYAKVT